MNAEAALKEANRQLGLARADRALAAQELCDARREAAKILADADALARKVKADG